ncbi:twitching motility protein PilT [Achromatium sp. WMS3]|nr:twitching motility protein PilT [Achromatium sp. WMS3]
MYPEKHIRLFRNGYNQILSIPHEFELDTEEAIIRKEGNKLIVEPISDINLLTLLTSWTDLDEVFPDVDTNLLPLDNIVL